MTLIIGVTLFLGALLLAIGLNSPAVGCSRIGSILMAIGFGLALFPGLG